MPKNRGVEFLELLEELAHDTCVERPDCPRCELRKVCPFALAKKYELPIVPPAAQPARNKPGATARPRASISAAITSTRPSALACEPVSSRSTSEVPRRIPRRVSWKPSSRSAAATAV